MCSPGHCKVATIGNVLNKFRKEPFLFIKILENIERHHNEGVARQTAFNFQRNEDSNEYQTLGLSITKFYLSECLGIMNTRKVARANITQF